jgi:methylase of polypeptide subunit release factors
LALEIGADQGESVPEMLQAAGYGEVAMTRDYADLPRVVLARRPASEG